LFFFGMLIILNLSFFLFFLITNTFVFQIKEK